MPSKKANRKPRHGVVDPECYEKPKLLVSQEVWDVFKTYKGLYGEFVAYCIGHGIRLRTMRKLNKRQAARAEECERCVGTSFEPDPQRGLACTKCTGTGIYVN